MGFITSFLFLLNASVWIFFDIICWYLTGHTFGWIGLAGAISFFIAWGLSGEATLSVIDYFWQTEWELFVTKIKWSNSVSLIVMFFVALIFIIFDLCDLREFLGWDWAQ